MRVNLAARREWLLCLGIVFISNRVYPQTNWAKYPDNPVHPGGSDPTVLLVNDTFQMWFATVLYDPSQGPMVGIGYAFSIDGITWEDDSSAFIEPGDPGSWDSKVRDTPFVLKDATGYKLWYTGSDSIGSWSDPLQLVIGYATSQNGRDWEFFSNPVLLKGPPGSWDEYWVESPCVTFENGIYKMWYTGAGSGGIQIGYATSVNGWEWEKYSSNPVLTVGEQGSGEDFMVGLPAVIKRDTTYEMWYAGVSVADVSYDDTIDTINIGYAISVDGIHWQKYENNPVLTTYYPNYDPDSSGPWAPAVLFLVDSFLMWYSGDSGIGLATAPLTGVAEKPAKNYPSIVSVNPNPARNFLNIYLSLHRRSKTEIRILKPDGRMVNTLYSEVLDKGTHKLVYQFGRNTSTLNPGVYFLQVVTRGQIHTIKVVVLQ